MFVFAVVLVLVLVLVNGSALVDNTEMGLLRLSMCGVKASRGVYSDRDGRRLSTTIKRMLCVVLLLLLLLLL